MSEAKYSELLEKLPVERIKGASRDKVTIEKTDIAVNFRFPS